ncbi:MAG: hypothetical protein KC486_04215 [Myxococcales bacterium]|nr:hypothetical protein [Myxococcales bacterium]
MAADPMDFDRADDELAAALVAVGAARRSSRVAALFAVREAFAGLALCALLGYGVAHLISADPLALILGLVGAGALAWLGAVLWAPHVFAPSAEIDGQLLDAYSKAERALDDLRLDRPKLALGWGEATPSRWSYRRQLVTIAATRRALDEARRAEVRSLGG